MESLTAHEEESSLPKWGKTGRPPVSAAGTYAPTVKKPIQNPGKNKNRGGKYAPLHDNPAKAAARALYEATPGSSCKIVAEKMGIPEGTIRRWKSEENWRPVARTLPNLAGLAGQLANTFKLKMSELGKPLSNEVAASEVSKELSVKHAVDIRAGILDRHRKEWSAPRRLIYEAVQKRDFDLAKLAKITSETLQIVQVGECRAFGLDMASRSQDGGTVVLIERDEAPLIEGAVGPVPDGPTGDISDDGEVF